MAKLISLDTKVDIFNLSVNEAMLESALNLPELKINAARVAHCDYLGIQMLVSFIKTAQNQGHSVVIEEASSHFVNAVRILGLEKEFNFMDKHHG